MPNVQNTETMPAKMAHSVDELCEQAPWGRSTIFAEIKAGRLRARKLRGRTIILDEDLRTYLRNLRSAA